MKKMGKMWARQKAETNNFMRKMLTPAVLFFIIMTVYPVFFTVLYSFTDYNYLNGIHQFIGLENYISLFSNQYFIQAIFNTAKFTVLAVSLETVLGILLALYVNSLKKGQKILRTLFLMPYLLPTVTVSLIWRMMLSPNYGIVTQLFEKLNLPVYNWFYDIKTAFGAILLIDVWQNIPFVFLLVYANLQTVSQSQYEAAMIDGAGGIIRFFKITLPTIISGLSLCIMLRVIDTLRLFEKVNILTGGGPANSTTTITQFMYSYGIKNLKFGFSSACAVVMSVFALILSVIYIRNLMREE